MPAFLGDTRHHLCATVEVSAGHEGVIMGFLNKLFGKADDNDNAPVAPFDSASVRSEVDELISALGALTDAMDTEDAPLSNPGWRGRLHDLREVRGDLRILTRRQDFTKDDLYEVLTCVRPLYRGEPPKDFAHLAPQNERVVSAIEDVHRAAGA